MKNRITFLFVFFLTFVFGVSPCLSQTVLKVGAIVPSSGRWGEAGKEFGRGMLDAARWLNEQGGVKGRGLEVLLVEDTFQLAEMIAAYRKLNEVDQILLLHIYSTETAQTLLPLIQFSRIPTLMGSLPSPLANPSRYPQVFSILPTPLDQAKIGITFISEKTGIQARRPKLVFIGSSDYGDQHFLQEAKIYANKAGLDVQRDVTFTDFSPAKEPGPDRRAKQTSSILSSIKQANADFAYLSVNSKEASSIIREARRIGLKTTWICNSRAFDETLVPQEGVLGVQPVSFFGEPVPGMTGVKEAHQKWHPDDTHTLSYVEGWATVRVMAEALERSLPEDRLSRERTRASLETFRNHVLGGLVPPLTIAPDDHRPSTESRILVIKDGKISIRSSFISVLRERKDLE